MTVGPPLLQALIGAFYSRPVYRGVARRWTTPTAFRYLFLLLALSWAVAMTKMHADLVRWARDDAQRIVAQVPELQVERGTLRTPEPRAYVVTDPGSGTRLAVIDTTGATTTLDAAQADILVTATDIAARRSAFEQRRFAVAELVEAGGLEGATIDHARLTAWLDRFVRWFPFLFYPFALFASYSYRLVSVVLLALVGLALARLRRVALPYDATLRVACVAVTPLIVAETALDLLGDSVPSPIALVITVGYLYLGIDANTGVDGGESAAVPTDLAAS